MHLTCANKLFTYFLTYLLHFNCAIFLYVIHDVTNFNEYVNDIDIRVDNVRIDENWVTSEAHSVQLS